MHRNLSHGTYTVINVAHDSDKAVGQDVQIENFYGVVRVARQIGLQPKKNHDVLITIKSDAFLSIDTRVMPISRYSIIATLRNYGHTTKKAFYIHADNFFNRQAHEPSAW